MALADGQPRDARTAVTRAAVVGRVVAVDADGTGSGLREMAQHGASGRAEADDDDVCELRTHGARLWGSNGSVSWMTERAKPWAGARLRFAAAVGAARPPSDPAAPGRSVRRGFASSTRTLR